MPFNAFPVTLSWRNEYDWISPSDYTEGKISIDIPIEWEKNKELFETSLSMLVKIVKMKQKKSGVTLKLFLKTQAGLGYSESLESVMSLFYFISTH